MSRTWATGRLRALRDWWRVYDTAVWDCWLAVAFTAVKYAAGQPTVVQVGYRGGHAEVEVTNIAPPCRSPAARNMDCPAGVA